jgi:hypothetical protein
LRPQFDSSSGTHQKAKLVEIVSSNNRETGTSERRKRALVRINQNRNEGLDD